MMRSFLIMKKHFLAGIVAAFGIVPALGADMATKAPYAAPVARPIYDWSGFYLGINGGWAQSHNCWDMNGALVFGFSPALAESCNTANGGVVGGQVGARYQVNNFVFGIEAMGDWANLKGSNTSTLFNNTTKVDAIGTFTGQIGYSFGALLWYVDGGVAVTDNKYSGLLTIAPVGSQFSASLSDSASRVKFGGVVGTGLEWMFAPNWTVGVKYDHLFMGSENVGTSLTSFSAPPLVVPAPLLAPGMPVRNDISGDIDMVTARVGYKF